MATRRPSVEEAGPIERASGIDMMELASDIGPAPGQVGAILNFKPGAVLDLDGVREGIARRIGGIPRLSQRLLPTPWGCGRPVWIDAAKFDIANHVHAARCQPPGDRAALLATATELVTSPLPADQPLWSATLIDQTADGSCALVVIFHHVLADGMGGLAVLASLVDGGTHAPLSGSPAEPPSPRELAYDASISRLRSLAHVGKAPGTIRAALQELRSGSVPRAARSSLNRPVGERRRMATATSDLEQVRTAAHAHGASVNDVILTAIGGALNTLLAHRGEHVDPFVISVPVSGRTQAAAGALGNQVGVMPIAVPAAGDSKGRLVAVVTDKVGP